MLNNFLQISTSETTANHFSLGSLGAVVLVATMLPWKLVIFQSDSGKLYCFTLRCRYDAILLLFQHCCREYFLCFLRQCV